MTSRRPLVALLAIAGLAIGAAAWWAATRETGFGIVPGAVPPALPQGGQVLRITLD